MPIFVIRLFLRELCRKLGYTHRVSTMTGNKGVLSADTENIITSLYDTVTDANNIGFVFAKASESVNYREILEKAVSDVRKMYIDEALSLV